MFLKDEIYLNSCTALMLIGLFVSLPLSILAQHLTINILEFHIYIASMVCWVGILVNPAVCIPYCLIFTKILWWKTGGV